MIMACTRSARGFDYTDLGTGQFIKTASSGSSTPILLAVVDVLERRVDVRLQQVGLKTRTAWTPTTISQFLGLRRPWIVAGVAARHLTGDIWIATNVATPSARPSSPSGDGSVASRYFDYTNINDSSLKVTARPTSWASSPFTSAFIGSRLRSGPQHR